MLRDYGLPIVTERLRRFKKRLAVIAHTLEVTATIISSRHIAISAKHTSSSSVGCIKLLELCVVLLSALAYIEIHNLVLVDKATSQPKELQLQTVHKDEKAPHLLLQV